MGFIQRRGSGEASPSCPDRRLPRLDGLADEDIIAPSMSSPLPPQCWLASPLRWAGGSLMNTAGAPAMASSVWATAVVVYAGVGRRAGPAVVDEDIVCAGGRRGPRRREGRRGSRGHPAEICDLSPSGLRASFTPPSPARACSTSVTPPFFGSIFDSMCSRRCDDGLDADLLRQELDQAALFCERSGAPPERPAPRPQGL